jgi:hypothetical protein
MTIDLSNISKCETPADPVHQEEGKWFFYDESWVDRYGPYDTEEEARGMLSRYISEVLEGIPSPSDT